MEISNHKLLKNAAILVAVGMLAATLGVVVSAQMGTRGGQGMGPGGLGGPGMMGRGFGMRGGPGGELGGMLGRGMRQLNLTDAQREQMRTIMTSHRDELTAIGDRMATARKALHDAVTAVPFDETVIRGKASDVAAVEADLAILHAKIHSAVFDLLTPEQKLKAQELRNQMEQRMKDRRGRMRQHIKQSSEPDTELRSGRPVVV